MKNLKITKALLLIALVCASQLIGMDNPHAGVPNNKKQQPKKRNRSNSDDELDLMQLKHLKLDDNDHDTEESDTDMDKDTDIEMLNEVFAQISFNTEMNHNIITMEEIDLVNKAKQLVYEADITESIKSELLNFEDRLDWDYRFTQNDLSLSKHFPACKNSSISDIAIKSLNQLPKDKKIILLHNQNPSSSLVAFYDHDNSNMIEIWRLDGELGECKHLKTINSNQFIDEKITTITQRENDSLAVCYWNSHIKISSIKLIDFNNKSNDTIFRSRQLITYATSLEHGKLALSLECGTVRILDLASGSTFDLIDTNLNSSCVTKLHNSFIASGSDSGVIQIWDTNRNKCIAQCDTSYQNTFTNNANLDTEMSSQDPCAHSVTSIIPLHKSNGNQFASLLSNDIIKIWNFNDILQTYECSKSLQNADTKYIQSIAQLCDGNIISSNLYPSQNKSSIKIWDIKTGKCLKSFEFTGSITQVIPLHNGDVLILRNYRTPTLPSVRPPSFTLAQIALIVKLHQHRYTSEIMEMHDDWKAILLTLPQCFQS
ncbi:hypothetical protein JST56_03190 [Candidatus Dependentiae bacterium]|nr:hypothetical protein [Candidatus Dependentiae bacterium]